MGSWKRAVLYIIRKKGRSTLLFLILFFLATLCLAGVILKSSADRESRALQESLGSSFVLKADMSNMGYYEPRTGENGYTYQLYTGPQVTREDIDAIQAIDGVKEVMLDNRGALELNLNLCPGSWSDVRPYRNIPQDEINIWKTRTLLFYCGEGERHPYFKNGAFEITEGRNIQQGDRFKAVISEKLAERNHIGLQDTLEARSVELDNEGMYLTDWSIELEIVGIFRVNFYQEVTEFTSEDEIADNFIYTDLETERQVREYSGQSAEADEYAKATFYTESPEQLDAVMKEAADRVDLEGLLLEKDDSDYAAAVKPYRQVEIAATFLLIVSAGICAVILYLIYTIWIRGRKKEMGILMALGMTRKKLLPQFFAEALLVAAAAFLAACVLAGPFTRAACKAAENLTAPAEDVQAYAVADHVGSGIEISRVSSEKIVLDSRLTATDIFFTALLNCGISVGSVFVAVIKNTGKDPKQLLDSI